MDVKPILTLQKSDLYATTNDFIAQATQNNLILTRLDTCKTKEVSLEMRINAILLVDFYIGMIETVCLVGLESGKFIVVDLDGECLVKEQLHNHPIISITVNTPHLGYSADNSMTRSGAEGDELCVFYNDKTIVQISTETLWLNLKLAKQSITQPPLSFKLFKIPDCSRLLVLGHFFIPGLNGLEIKPDAWRELWFLGLQKDKFSLLKVTRKSIVDKVMTNIKTLTSAFGYLSQSTSPSNDGKLEIIQEYEDGFKPTLMHASPINYNGHPSFIAILDKDDRVIIFEVKTALIIKIIKTKAKSIAWIKGHTLILAIQTRRAIDFYDAQRFNKYHSIKCQSGQLVASNHFLFKGYYAQNRRPVQYCYLLHANGQLERLEPKDDIPLISNLKHLDLIKKLVKEYLRIHQIAVIPQLFKDYEQDTMLDEIKSKLMDIQHYSLVFKGLKLLNGLPMGYYVGLVEKLVDGAKERVFERDEKYWVDQLGMQIDVIKGFVRMQMTVESSLPENSLTGLPTTFLQDLKLLNERLKPLEGLDIQLQFIEFQQPHSQISFYAFIDAFECRDSKLYLNSDLTERQLQQLSQYLYVFVYSGYPIPLSLEPSDFLVLMFRFLERMDMKKISKFGVENLISFACHVIQKDRERCFKLLEQFYRKTDLPIVAYICILAHLHLLLPSDTTKDNLTKIIDKFHKRILPLYYFLKGDCFLQFEDFELRERASVLYIIANHLQKSNYLQSDESYQSFLQTCEPFISNDDGKQIISFYQIFNSISVYERSLSLAEIKTIKQLIPLIEDETLIYVIIVVFYAVLIEPNMPEFHHNDKLLNLDFLGLWLKLYDRLPLSQSKFEKIETVMEKYFSTKKEFYDGLMGEVLHLFQLPPKPYDHSLVLYFRVLYFKTKYSMNMNPLLLFPREFFEDYGIRDGPKGDYDYLEERREVIASIQSGIGFGAADEIGFVF